MNSEKSKPNNALLKYSVIFSAILSISALIIGFMASSQVILYDGIFTLIGIALTYLSILSVKFIKKKDFKNYPFGKEAFEPFVVITQYAVILAVSISNMVSAIQIVLAGGTDMDINSGIIYGLLSSILCFAAYMFLKYIAKKNATAIEKVEVEQWKYSFLFSLTMFIGFSVAGILSKTFLVAYVAYVDPVLAILITIAFIKTSVSSIRTSIKELLHATPSPELTSLIKEKVDLINRRHHFSNMVLRIGKDGQELIVEIDYIIEENSELDSIRKQDQLRSELSHSLSEIPYKKWLSITFTGDIKWAE